MPPEMQALPSSRPTWRLAPVDDDTLSRDLGFLHELVSAKDDRLKAMKPKIVEFKRRHGLNATTYAQILATYRDPNNGPCKARRKLQAANRERNGEEVEVLS